MLAVRRRLGPLCASRARHTNDANHALSPAIGVVIWISGDFRNPCSGLLDLRKRPGILNSGRVFDCQVCLWSVRAHCEFAGVFGHLASLGCVAGDLAAPHLLPSSPLPANEWVGRGSGRAWGRWHGKTGWFSVSVPEKLGVRAQRRAHRVGSDFAGSLKSLSGRRRNSPTSLSKLLCSWIKALGEFELFLHTRSADMPP